MDLTYSTMPIFWGEHRRLYRELQLAYLVSDNDNPKNHLIYVVQEDIGSCMLHLNDENAGIFQVEKEVPIQRSVEPRDNLWKLYLDESSSQKGEGKFCIDFSM